MGHVCKICVKNDRLFAAHSLTTFRLTYLVALLHVSIQYIVEAVELGCFVCMNSNNEAITYHSILQSGSEGLLRYFQMGQKLKPWIGKGDESNTGFVTFLVITAVFIAKSGFLSGFDSNIGSSSVQS